MQINLITTLPPRAPRRAGEGPGTATAGGRCRGPGGVFWGTRWGRGGPVPSGKVWGAIAILPAKRPQGRSCARTRVHTRARIHARPPGGTKAALWFGARLPGPGGWHWHGAGSLKGRPVCGQPARQGCQRGLAVGTQRRGTQGQRASTGHPPQRPRLQLEGPGRCAPLRLHGRAGTRGHTRAHACTHVGAGTRRRARAEALASTLARVCVYIYICRHICTHARAHHSLPPSPCWHHWVVCVPCRASVSPSSQPRRPQRWDPPRLTPRAAPMGPHAPPHPQAAPTPGGGRPGDRKGRWKPPLQSSTHSMGAGLTPPPQPAPYLSSQMPLQDPGARKRREIWARIKRN